MYIKREIFNYILNIINSIVLKPKLIFMKSSFLIIND